MKDRIKKGGIIIGWKIDQILNEFIRLRYTISNEDYKEIEIFKDKMLNKYIDSLFR